MATDPSHDVDEMIALWEDHGIDVSALRSPLLRRLSALPAPSTRPTAATPPGPATLNEVRTEAVSCRRCRLCDDRRHVVFGEGAARARLMFVLDAPTAEEDSAGRALSGPAGELLTKIIEAMQVGDGGIFVTAVVKCHPREDRAPVPDEIESCTAWLKAQIDLIDPAVVVALGPVATQLLLGAPAPLTTVRGRFHPLAWRRAVAVMPTYPPGYLLKNPAAKRVVWEDMKQVMTRLKNA